MAASAASPVPRTGDAHGRTTRRILPAGYVLASQRLLLRPFRRDEAQSLASLAADPRISRWTDVLPQPIEWRGALAFIEAAARQAARGLDYAFAVESRADGRMIGCVGLHPAASTRLARLGYWLGYDFWNRGFGTEAIGAALSVCFGPLRMERVEADVHEDNVGSWRALEKAGFLFERRGRRAFPSRTGTAPVRCYGLDRGLWNGEASVMAAAPARPSPLLPGGS